MRILKLSTFLIVVLISLASCVEEVKLKPLEDRAITVSCVLKNNPVQDMQLYYIKPYIEDSGVEYEPITEASVQLYLHSETENGEGARDSVLVGSFVHKEGRRWELDYTTEVKRTYSLVVEKDGKSLYGKTVMPDSILRDNFTHPRWTGYLDAPVTIGNFCPSKTIYVNSKSTLWAYGLDNNGNVAPLIFTSHINVDNFNISSEGLIKTYTIFKENYKDLTDVDTHELFFNYHKYYVRFIHYPKLFQPLYWFPDLDTEWSQQHLHLFTSGNESAVLGSDNSIWGTGFHLHGVRNQMTDLYVMNVSNEYDQYLYSCLSKLLEEPTGDFTELFDQTNSYSNIHNGTGIFGAAFIIKTRQF